MSINEVGERLSKIAAFSGIKHSQIENLLAWAETRSLDELAAKVKYQIARGIEGWNEFGPPLLEVVEQPGQNKTFVIGVIKRVAFTFEYYRMEPLMSRQPQIEAIAKKVASNFGYHRTAVTNERGLSVDVYVNNFHVNGRQLSDQIKSQLLRSVPELSKTHFEVWVNPRRR
jgi:hypothetical protein